jgi:ABC-2 type transport system permease protein
VSAVLAIALKDLRLVVRDKVALFWALGFPVLFALLMSAVLDGATDRGPGTIDVAVVDEDESAASARVRDVVTRAENVRAHDAARKDAEDQVRHGALHAVVRVPEGFGAKLGTDEERPLELAVDPARKLETVYLRAVLAEAFMRGGPDGEGERAARAVSIVPISDGRGGHGSGFEIVLPTAIVWALMGCAATFAVAIVSERASGTLLRLRAAPVGAAALLAGKALAAFVTCAAAAALLLVIGRVAFGAHVDRAAEVALAIGSVAFCFVGITMVLANLGRTAQAVNGAGWATLLLFAMLGGAMVPLAAMPAWIRALSVVSPIRWGIFALEAATWRGLTIAEMARACASLVATGAIALAVGLGAQARARP